MTKPDLPAEGGTRSDKPKPTTLGEILFMAYANLAMAHMAIVAGDARYGRKHCSVGSRLLAGLRKGTMGVDCILDDEYARLRSAPVRLSSAFARSSAS